MDLLVGRQPNAAPMWMGFKVSPKNNIEEYRYSALPLRIAFLIGHYQSLLG